ncbi:unnamed protein product [Thelazia callipaeda]|uniref:ARD n=1 Tax=Thelazia callipaeda TaxID=103827 RepID=A0A0N5CY42_THECL|nr:unnamed protein product [Thelazia callipaeda]
MEPFPCGDRRLPHHIFPPKTYTLDQLQSLTGVVAYKVDIDDQNALKKRTSRVKAERNVVASDIFTLHEHIHDFEQKINNFNKMNVFKLEQFYKPMRKEEDVIFLVMDGSAYYDVEVEEDDWIRINVERGDLIVIPKGRNHRFTLTPQVMIVH